MLSTWTWMKTKGLTDITRLRTGKESMEVFQTHGSQLLGVADIIYISNPIEKYGIELA